MGERPTVRNKSVYRYFLILSLASAAATFLAWRPPTQQNPSASCADYVKAYLSLNVAHGYPGFLG